MPRLIYIDTLRMVSPGSALEDDHFDFYLLGSFDAMKIAFQEINTFVDFQKRSRRRHTEVPVHYDKQPMCLYSDCINADQSISIFQKDGGYESKPLVMTLVQLHDEILNLESPERLIDAFRRKLYKLIDAEADFKNIDFDVFYSLGEVDVVLVFRDASVGNIARLLYRLRAWDTTSENEPEGIRILSICSHCAFPSAKGQNEFKVNVQAWMQQEQSHDFVTLLDTSYGAENNLLAEDCFRFDKYLLGEYDYLDPWPKDGKNTSTLRTERYYDEIIRPMQEPDLDHPNYFRTAFTVPIVKLHPSDIGYSEIHHTLKTIQTNYEDIISKYENPQRESAFKELARRIREYPNKHTIFGDTKSATYLSHKLEAMADTLVGLLKHLIRLKEGRFEGDLYAYVIPVFEAMPEVTRSYDELICRLISQYDENYQVYSSMSDDIGNYATKMKVQEEMRDLSDRVCALLSEYIQDVSRLISLLQHLFSILSVSPHTYLETYGSNMRSIAATCKLLGAYQGITFRVSKDYSMQLRNYDMMGKFLGDEYAKETMLVLPYRSIRQSTRTLFEHASPLHRIVSVRLDFADMMDINRTLYLLLHEIGHHIIDFELRKDRKEPLVTAIFAYLLQTGLGSMYEEPYSCLDLPRLTQDEARSVSKRMTNWLSGVKTLSEKDVRAVIAKYLQIIAEEMYQKFDADWNKYVKEVHKKEEPISLNNLFSGLLRIMLNNFISERLSAAYETDERIHIRQDDQYFANWIRDLCKNNVLKVYGEIVKEQYSIKLYEDNVYAWRLDELCVWYSEVEKSPEFVERIVRAVLRKIEFSFREAVEEFFSMYSDIYSDIFAFYMLRLDMETGDKVNLLKLAEEYIRLYKDMTGFEINQNAEKVWTLIRLRILLTACYGLSKKNADSMIVKILFQNSPLKQSVKDTMKRIDESVYYDYVKQYAEKCKEALVNKRKEEVALKKDTEVLHRMYMGARSNDIREVVSNIHYFWMTSTKRKGESQNDSV